MARSDRTAGVGDLIVQAYKTDIMDRIVMHSAVDEHAYNKAILGRRVMHSLASKHIPVIAVLGSFRINSTELGFSPL